MEDEQHVNVEMALPWHLGNLTSIPCSFPRLLCVTLGKLFHPFVQLVPSDREISVSL